MADERTLSIIKPDATRRNLSGKINARFEETGLRIIAQKRLLLTRPHAEGFYEVHKERAFFDDLCNFMTSGPVVVQVLEGENAIEMAVGLGAAVTVVDKNLDVLAHLSARFGASLETMYSTRTAIEHLVRTADLVIGGVLVKGSRAPKLVTEAMVRTMRPGSVLVDVAIDQGGCFETSRPTTHEDPTYVLHDVVHYCVTNMPGGVPQTSTHALNNATLPFVLSLADKGAATAIADDPHLRNGCNVIAGKVTEIAVAEALGYDYHEPLSVLGG